MGKDNKYPHNSVPSPREDGKRYYGTWAGNPKGNPEVEGRCLQTVGRDVGRWTQFGQCDRKNGHGPDGAFCKQHDPEKIIERNRIADEKSNAQWEARKLEIYGGTFAKALMEIFKGHNNPSERAAQALSLLGEDWQNKIK